MNNLFEDELIKKIQNKIKGQSKVVVVPEGSEIRVIKSLSMTPDIVKKLLGEKTKILERIKQEYPNNYETILQQVQIIEPHEYVTEQVVNKLVKLRKGKLDFKEAQKLLQKPNYIATMMLENGEADALVGGSEYATVDILRPAFQIIKTRPQTKLVSSFFLLQKEEQKLLFADCAINVNPSAEQLKEIALQTINSAHELGMTPKVAFLSYSTKGSATGESVDKVYQAYELLIKENPAYEKFVEGELQFDAAWDKEVSNIKAPTSKIKGQANIFIFPSLEAGNIGYKIAQYLGNWSATGPLLQGLNKPVNDLSRGTTPETIAKVMYLSLK
ncbi:MAG: phosphate acetyltransferase [Mycoplasmatales bacterium]